MSEVKEKQLSIKSLVCPVCGGTGETKGKRCASCSGRGVGLLVDGLFFYWDRRVDYLTIVQNRAVKFVRTAIDAVFFVFGLFGLFSLLWQFWPVLQGQFNFEFLLARLLEKNNLMFAFGRAVSAICIFFIALAAIWKAMKKFRKRNIKLK